MVVEQLSPGHVLPDSRADLPQAGVDPEREPPGTVDGPGGGHGPVEVAGIYRVKVDALKPLFQGLHLLPALAGEQAVVPAVAAAVEIALRLSVADKIYGGHCNSFFLFTRGGRRR